MAFFNKLTGCFTDIIEKIKEVIGFGIPTAFVTGIRIASIDLKKATLVFDVLVTNPSRFTIPLTDINYLLESDDRKLLSGLIPDSGTISPKGSTTIVIPVTLVYEDILNTFTDIRPGSVIPYKMKVEFGVEVPIFGKKTIPIEKSGEIPIPTIPLISLEKIEFKKFSFEECVVAEHLKLENMNEFEMGVTSLELELQLSGKSIGSAGLEKTGSVGKSGVSMLVIPLTFRPVNLGMAVWEVLGGNEATYALKGNLGVDTPFGSMTFPMEKDGGTSFIK
ncbi:late embryogenesis abundant protein Lea14-A-like [Magnolia sinica]|uniref:late embryogenesis abundant protein Lea14-A-like n=1 Tax=Magnolia sinica TaxID=86752 RepID=UPI002659677E|nr:late embryogenesis abundant protein Lea14-A-like [Magnolia sinica]